MLKDVIVFGIKDLNHLRINTVKFLFCKEWRSQLVAGKTSNLTRTLEFQTTPKDQKIVSDLRLGGDQETEYLIINSEKLRRSPYWRIFV